MDEDVVKKRISAFKKIISTIRAKGVAKHRDLVRVLPYRGSMIRELTRALVDAGLIVPIGETKQRRYALAEGVDEHAIDYYARRMMEKNVEDAIIECLMTAPEQAMYLDELRQCVSQQYLFLGSDIRRGISYLVRKGLARLIQSGDGTIVSLVAPAEGLFMSPRFMRAIKEHLGFVNVEDVRKLLETMLKNACSAPAIVLDYIDGEVLIRCGDVEAFLDEADSAELFSALRVTIETLEKVGYRVLRMIKRERKRRRSRSRRR